MGLMIFALVGVGRLVVDGGFGRVVPDAAAAGAVVRSLRVFSGLDGVLLVEVRAFVDVGCLVDALVLVVGFRLVVVVVAVRVLFKGFAVGFCHLNNVCGIS